MAKSVAAWSRFQPPNLFGRELSDINLLLNEFEVDPGVAIVPDMRDILRLCADQLLTDWVTELTS